MIMLKWSKNNKIMDLTLLRRENKDLQKNLTHGKKMMKIELCYFSSLKKQSCKKENKRLDFVGERTFIVRFKDEFKLFKDESSSIVLKY